MAKDFAVTKTDEFFAAMPPIEALRMLLSFVATGRSNGRDGKKILVKDAKKAHLHAFPDRDVFVRLPPRDPPCGILRPPAAMPIWHAGYASKVGGLFSFGAQEARLQAGCGECMRFCS